MRSSVEFASAIHFEFASIVANKSSAVSLGSFFVMPLIVLGFLPAPGRLPPFPAIDLSPISN